jgi:hypothetical protein
MPHRHANRNSQRNPQRNPHTSNTAAALPSSNAPLAPHPARPVRLPCPMGHPAHGADAAPGTRARPALTCEARPAPCMRPAPHTQNRTTSPVRRPILADYAMPRYGAVCLEEAARSLCLRVVVLGEDAVEELPTRHLPKRVRGSVTCTPRPHLLVRTRTASPSHSATLAAHGLASTRTAGAVRGEQPGRRVGPLLPHPLARLSL